MGFAGLAGPPRVEAREPFDHAGLARLALERHIRPGYARLRDAARHMSEGLAGACATPGQWPRQDVMVAFFDLVAAWGRIEHIQFGPIADERRIERVLFWPDRRGIALKQVQKAIETRDGTAADPALLAAKSVAVQGLGALEHLIFEAMSTSAPGDLPFACRYAQAVAGNILAIAEAVVAGWAEGAAYPTAWLSAGQPGSPLPVAAETTTQLAKAYIRGLERVRDERIAGPLGFGKSRRPTGVVFEKSGRPLVLLVANVEGLLHLFTTGGMRDAIAATDVKHEDINIAPNLDLIVRELRTSLAALTAIRGSRHPFMDPDRQKIVAIGFPLKNANVQANALLALTADVSLGFNASDGD